MLYFFGMKVTPVPLLSTKTFLETILLRWKTLSKVFSPGWRVMVVVFSLSP